MKLRTTEGSSVATVAFLKDKTGELRPARRHTFVHVATKVIKNALLLAEGISFTGFLRDIMTTEHNKPARYWGASLAVSSMSKSLVRPKIFRPAQSERLSRASGLVGEM